VPDVFTNANSENAVFEDLANAWQFTLQITR
jgi:hypothetical protein